MVKYIAPYEPEKKNNHSSNFGDNNETLGKLSTTIERKKVLFVSSPKSQLGGRVIYKAPKLLLETL